MKRGIDYWQRLILVLFDVHVSRKWYKTVPKTHKYLIHIVINPETFCQLLTLSFNLLYLHSIVGLKCTYFHVCLQLSASLFEEISQQGNKPTYQLINQTISLLTLTPAYFFTILRYNFICTLTTFINFLTEPSVHIINM